MKQLQHFVLLLAYNKEKDSFRIADPASGIKDLSSEELEDIWKSKALLLLEGTTRQFQLKKDSKKGKLNWLVEMVKPDLDILLSSLFLGLIMSILNLSVSIFSQTLVDDILPERDVWLLMSGLLLLILLLFIKGVLGYLRHYFLLRQSKDFNIRLIQYFFNSLLYLPKSFFDNRKTGDLIARMNDTAKIQQTVSYLVSQVMIDLLMILISTLAIMSYSWSIGVLSFVIFPVYFLISWKMHIPY